MQIKLVITITTGIVSGTVAILAVLGYVRQQKSRHIYEFAATAIATSTAITGATYVAQDLKQSANASKIDRTLAYIQRWNDSGFKKRKVIGLLRELKNQPSSQTGEYITEQLKDDELYAELTATLNFLEEMALAIHEGLVDGGLLHNFFRGIVKDYSEGLHDWIALRIKQRKTEKLYSHLRKLAKEWTGHHDQQ